MPHTKYKIRLIRSYANCNGKTKPKKYFKGRKTKSYDRKMEQKDEELNLERYLWNSRESGWDPSTGTDLHRIEVFDGVISDESNLHSATVQLGRVQVYFGTCRGMRHCLLRHATVSRR